MSEYEQEQRIRDFLIWLDYSIYQEVFIDDKENLNTFLIDAGAILYDVGPKDK